MDDDSKIEDATRAAARCPRCGNALPVDALEGLCPACLLAAGVETLTGRSTDDHATRSVGSGDGAADEGSRLEPGQAWGPYRIGRLLGRGGMGEVYEAEHVESGRRIALKVLRSRLRNADDRARFLREGQLAASVSHPHTVYIFGSEEIAGMPVISMELLPGGTLKDRVVAEGPLPPTKAVEAVLEIIGGLDAAHSAGILHRDIKPSNCFVDTDGTVKVGDFGLSISTLARDVRHELETSGFQGTPQFAPPEQLRGEPLDVRADIYAVGATLYYLLTGRPPFDSRDLRELVGRVTKETPVSPRTIRKEIPPGLASIVLKCLAKSPAERPATYAALADLLRPYAHHDERPANLVTRFVAAIVDSVIISVVGAIWSSVQMGLTGVIPQPGFREALLSAAYSFGFEGFQGASPGKRLLGLAVTSNSTRASWTQIAIRTAAFHLPGIAIRWFMGSGKIVIVGPPAGQSGASFTTDAGGIAVAITLTYFLFARRTNGWAALHDRLSGTRVVARSARVRSRQVSVARAADPSTPAVAPDTTRYGPFATISDVGKTNAGQLVVGFDPVLRRRVWIHVLSPGALPISPARRDVGRSGRLHWLTGKRSSTENWDAYEAPDGEPLVSRVLRMSDGGPASPKPRSGEGGPVSPKLRRSEGGWPVVKHWLLDLSHELAASAHDGTMPPLGLDRLWLRSDGRLVLLDFAPSVAQASVRDDRVRTALTPAALLADVAKVGLSDGAGSGPVASMPLSARALIARWSNSSSLNSSSLNSSSLDSASLDSASLNDTRKALEQVAAAPDRVTRWRRNIPMAIASMPIVVMMFVGAVTVPMITGFFASEDAQIVGWLASLSEVPDADSRLNDPAYRTAMERYVAGRYRERLQSDDLWSFMGLQGDLAALRKTGDEILARHPSVSQEELAEATEILAPELEEQKENREWQEGFLAVGEVIIACLVALALVFVVLVSVLSSIAVPGGLATRGLGLAVVTRDGVEIGRGRSVLRVLVAWLPALVWFVYLLNSPRMQGWVPNPPQPLVGMSITLGLMIIGNMWTLWSRTRGPHDWVTGTWVVQR